ncbi:beta-Ala-His dipeptidase [Oscillospiraceae bacterium MB08-C2-2]|nr:beta-Ala-His dipeptidase [Oscillospiraceae bacterium MB08-C2-2]
MEYLLRDRQPQHIMRFFEEISAIPRCSGNEKQISDYVVDFAKKQRLSFHQDSFFNVVVRKPASPGCENKPGVILQGHLDMVGEKAEGSSHDFESDPLTLVVEGDILRAKDTTLGADNGVAVAYMLAALEDQALVHPPLECVFTTQEEVGLVGATNLDGSQIAGRRLINLDCGPEGALFSTCAGGLRITLDAEVQWEQAKGTGFSVAVRGLKGGHSGVEIGKQRGNACKLLARVLACLRDSFDVRLVSLAGGDKDNVIPNNCTGVMQLVTGDMGQVEQEVRKLAAVIQKELAVLEPEVEIHVASVGKVQKSLSKADTARLLDLLLALPNGVRGMSTAIEGLVALSANLASVCTTDTGFAVRMSLRANADSQKAALYQEVEAIARGLGVTCTPSNGYPGWAHAEHSPLRELCQKVYGSLYNKEFSMEGTHGGLECGILGAKLPGVDMVAIGPDNMDFHSVKETLDLASFSRVWEFLATLMAEMCK